MILYRYSTFEIRMNQGTLLRISIGGFEEWKFFLKYVLPLTTSTQYAERILNKTAKAINETCAGLKLMLQGFRIYFL